METLRFPFYARLALVLFSLVLISVILRAADSILVPLLFAGLIAILLLPLTKFFERRMKLGRAAAALLSVGLFLLSIGGILYMLALQLAVFANDFPVLRTRFLDMYDDVQHWLSAKLHITIRQQTEYVNRSVSELVTHAGDSVRNLFFSLSGVLLLLIFIFIFTFFILYYRRLLVRFVMHLFSEEHRAQVMEVILETRSMTNAYIVGLVVEMFIVSVLNCAMFFVMGVPYPVLLGVMVALLNVIPYLGFYTSIVICMLVTFANSGGALALQAGLGLFVVHLLDSNVIFPRIIGGRMKMNPFITILAVIAGELIWGIPGMFLFIPIAGIVKLVCERVEGLKAWGILIGVDEPPQPAVGAIKEAIDKQGTKETDDE